MNKLTAFIRSARIFHKYKEDYLIILRIFGKYSPGVGGKSAVKVKYLFGYPK